MLVFYFHGAFNFMVHILKAGKSSTFENVILELMFV